MFWTNLQLLNPEDGGNNFLQIVGNCLFIGTVIYRVSQEERSVFWDSVVSAILSKKVYMYMCPIPNGFRGIAILLYSYRIVDKKDILCTVSNTNIYCPSDKVGTVYLIPPSTSMQFATRMRTWHVARLYSEIVISQKPFRIGHMYIYTFSFRMTDTVISQNIDLCTWDILYIPIN
jgi:hypothetical protein